jgi:hypothetical protein
MASHPSEAPQAARQSRFNCVVAAIGAKLSANRSYMRFVSSATVRARRENAGMDLAVAKRRVLIAFGKRFLRRHARPA